MAAECLSHKKILIFFWNDRLSTLVRQFILIFSQPHLNMGAIVHTPGHVSFAEVLFFLPKL